MNVDQQVEAVIAHHSKSFALASKLLAPAVRKNAVSVYAWCRRADDAVDLADRDSGSIALAELREELDAVYADQSMDDPILNSFQRVVSERKLPRIYCEELLAGMEMDLHVSRYETFDDLLLYCYRVAGVVGLMMCHVLGVADDRALEHAAHLGIAMQLTNIARDVEEDWQRGRLYLPLEWLDEKARQWATTSPANKIDRSIADRLRPAVKQLLEVAGRYYRSGDAGIQYLDGRSATAILTAGRVYSQIGEVIAGQNYDVLAGRAYVSKPRKLAIALSTMGRGLFRRSARQVDIPTTYLNFRELTAPEIGNKVSFKN